MKLLQLLFQFTGKKAIHFFFYSMLFLLPCFYVAQDQPLDSLEGLLRKEKIDSVRIRIKYQIGIEKPMIRVGYWDTLLIVAEKNQLKYLEALCLNQLGSIYDELDPDMNTCLKYFNRALEIFIELGNKRAISNNYHIISYVYHDHGKSDEALQYLHKSLKIREEIGDKKGMGESVNNIGFIFQSQGKINQALEYFHRAIKLFEEVGDKTSEAYLLNNIAFLQQGQGDTANALVYYPTHEEWRERGE